MAVTQAQVAQLYVALFNRAPEGDGFRAWVNLGANKTQSEIAQLMLESQAARDYYNGSIDSDRDYIELIYKNILGKDYTKDPDGINAWVMHLQAGNTRGETLIKLFEVAQSAEARAADPVAAAVFDNKTAISAYMAEKIAGIQQDLSGNYDYRPFQEIIKTTTATNLEEQKAKVDALASSTIHNLSTDTNDITGTVGQDIFNAVADSLVSNATLKPTDKIDGGSGENTLNVRVNDDFNGMTTGYIKNIDNLNLTSNASTAKTFNARGIEGLKRVTLDSQNGLNLLNPKNIVDVSLENLKSNVDKFNLHYNTDTIAGVNDSQNLTLDNVNLHKYAITGVVGSDDAGINIPNIETLNISTKGEKSTVAIKSGNAGTSNQNHYKTINVKGNTDLTVKAESDRIEKFDASAFTATLDYTYKPLASTPVGATNVVKGGSSKDIINLDFKDLAVGNKTNFEIDGGAGRDELNVKYLKADENKFTVNNVEKVDIHRVEGSTAANKLHTMDFGGSDVTHLHTNAFKDNLKVTNSTIKSVTVDKVRPDDDGNVTAAPWGTTQFTNGYLEEINVTNTVDAQNPQGEAIIDPTIPGLRSVVSAYVSADQSEKVTVNIGKNVLAQKIAGNWIANTTDRTHADNAIGIIAPKAKDITVNFNSPGTFGNGHANTTGISITNLSLADLTATPTQVQKTQEKLTINSKSNILSNVDATFLEKLKVFNINTDTNFEAYAQREFNDIQQINASGLASNNIKTGKVYFIDNVIGKGSGAVGSATADATQSIGIKAEHLNSFKANVGIFTKGNINVVLNDMQGNVEMVNGLNTSAVAGNTEVEAHFENSFTNANANLQYASAPASVVTEGTFRIQAWDITNLLVGNIIARDIDISAGNARGNVSLATGGSQYTTAASPYAGAVGKIGNEKTINNNIDMSQVAGSYTIGELFGQNIKFKSAVFNSPTYYSDQIDTGLFSDKNNYNSNATTNTIKANFGGARASQDVISLETKGVQSNADGNTNVYVKFDDGTASPNDLKTFKATGEAINLIVNGKFNAATTSKLETIDLSDVKTGSTSFLNLSDVAFSTDTTTQNGNPSSNYGNYHNLKENGGFGVVGGSNLKNPLFDNKGITTNFKATTTLKDWGGTHVTGNDVPNFHGYTHRINGADSDTDMSREKSALGTNQHTKLSHIKGTQGNDVVLLANDMATGVAANPQGIKQLHVDLGDGDDIIHVGTLAPKTEIVIDGGRGRDLFDVSRAKTDTTANKIVTIKNIEAGDKIKLADWFAHGYDPKSPDIISKVSQYSNSTLHANGVEDTKVKFYNYNSPDTTLDNDDPTHGRYFHTTMSNNNNSKGVFDNMSTSRENSAVDTGSSGSNIHGQRDEATNPSKISGYMPAMNTEPTIQPGIEKGVVAQGTGHTDGHAGGDRYEYTAKYGDLAWQGGTAATNDRTVDTTAAHNISVGGKGANGQYTGETFLNGNTKPFVETGSAPVTADLSTTKSTGVTVSTAGWTQGTTPTTPHPTPGVTWVTWIATKVNGSTIEYYAPSNVHAAAPTQGTGNWRLNTDGKFYETGTAQNQHTIVNNVLYSNEYTDIHGANGPANAVIGGTPILHNGNVIIQNSGIQGQIGPNATTPTQTNLRKAILIETASDSSKHTTTISSNDKAIYDAHNIVKLTVNTKYIDLSNVAGMDTLIQAINQTISVNRMWNDTTAVRDDGLRIGTTYFTNQNGDQTYGQAISGYVRHINWGSGDNGSYEAHNDRLYAFSWKGDTYLVYDKNATAAGTANTLTADDTIVRLAGVNLENLQYRVDAKTGTIEILSTDHFNG